MESWLPGTPDIYQRAYVFNHSPGHGPGGPGVVPGASCPVAGSLPVPFVYTGNIAAGQVDWWQVAVVAGQQYTFIVTVNSGVLGLVNLYNPPCAFLTLIGTVMIPPGVYVFNAPATGFILIAVNANVFIGANYTISTHSP
jgi:hypothetical protein